MKNLFSESLSKKRIVIITTSFIVFAAALGFFIFESTKKTVAMTLDGQEKFIKTHAGTIQELFNDLDISLRKEDYVSLSLDTKVKNNLEIVWEPAKQVHIVKDNEKKTIWTVSKTVEELLKEQEITITDHDKVQPNLEEPIKNKLEIVVNKAFALTLSDGGKEQQVWSTSTTVADFLSQQGITLNELDRIEPKADTVVKKDDTIQIIRVEKVTDVVEEPIKFAVVTKKDSSLAKGSQKVINQGKEGLLTKEYEVVLENGKEVSRKLLSEKTVKEKQDKMVAVGTKPLAVNMVASRGETGGKEIHVSSTAYTAYCNGCSGKTATGINLRANPDVKVIAVDPRVIPLGTKVYVEGYGYAIAADTGSAIKGNKIDVFFATKAEAYRWGRKKVKIRILN
ncbi:ubiquitin-like domain-containing protein [Bacillus sp. DTU_2020_1000418_1_SI_GHA_SEK_038]|uniref:ubiquitin-like domain-containing protein n=1 Tax=Bacillus sp. DTU_2020_1000418_1_SI_GHA_SEK_038 TaxID=3077585 RepID=UPI0028E9B591|nr:ubiquitin-like domain-containing protein [Bacillus sp. DTU_2020_1000418_1_SI_GHA_SEK_038]WNS75539.1 ubiquitin-like domain-containing protein [Bacillus sp. DTU_2020_1000418_1_SI_GHA_SEK_038]